MMVGGLNDKQALGNLSHCWWEKVIPVGGGSSKSCGKALGIGNCRKE